MPKTRPACRATGWMKKRSEGAGLVVLRVGWFSTGRGEGSRGLLDFVQTHIARGGLDATIDFVFSNRERGEAEGSDGFFQLVGDHGLSLETLSSSRFARSRAIPFAQVREEFDVRVMEMLAGYQPDICVLAGYMLIVGGAMCRNFPLLNLHPALPDGPIGTWQQVIWELIGTRAELTGAMVHLATEEVDRGPVVSHCTVPIAGPGFTPLWDALSGQDLREVKESAGENLPLFRLIREAEYGKEPYLLLETLRVISQGKVMVGGGAVLDPSGQAMALTGVMGINLDQEIALAMAQDGVEEGA